MALNRESMEALRLMGLTDYETQTYVALTSLISANATEISLAANVPRSKVYQVLKNLVEKDFVEMNRGKPLKFTVIPPHEVFKRSRNHIRETMDQAEAELNMVYESQIPQVPAPIWLLHGQEKILSKEMEIISRAKESLFIMGGLMFPEEPDELKSNLEKPLQKGVNIRMLTAPVCWVDDVEVPTQEILKSLPLQIKFFPVPFIKLIVRDKKEMLIAFCKLSGNTAISETAIGIWNQYQEFVDTISGIYEFIWNTDFFQ
ncbi:TrmB family transcriptional regulator [Methanobacterium petrolearium]|uniref:TrmB family transcriptional regulator n=2 Tax=Methanobacterium petrolearium TaxID=710190 RepID=UPI001AE8AE6F|nr:TrmB family transcriptional regulator [Methanobacterium petrolearium]MBP1946876.1 sugar-specific transcriptional regulator TrmB [Methanobacterium petrolearium]